jgi:hypothetical protein
MPKRRKPYIPYEVVQPFGAYLGFCSDTKAFFNETTRLGWVPQTELMPADCKAMTHSGTDSEGGFMSIICMSAAAKESSTRDPIWFYGILAHESWHVVSDIFEHYAEKKPGEETTAYLLEYVFEAAANQFKKQGFAASP